MDVPDYVSTAARRGLEWHGEGKSGDGVTDQTIAEARDMAAGTATEDKVRRMGPWFQRHRPDMDAPKNDPASKDFPGAGAVAWALWGGPTSGDIMRTADWAEAKVRQLDADAINSKNSKVKMTIEDQLLEATLANVALSAERDDLRTSVEKLAAGAASELETLKVEVAVKDQSIATLSETVKFMESQLATAQALVQSLEAGKISASKEAAKIVASVGVSPVEMSPSDSKPTAEAVDHLTTFMSLPVGSKERNDYFAAHKHAIIKAAI